MGKLTLSGHVSGLSAGQHCAVRELLLLKVGELHNNYGLHSIDITEPSGTIKYYLSHTLFLSSNSRNSLCTLDRCL